jgi:hypothetical protein
VRKLPPDNVWIGPAALPAKPECHVPQGDSRLAESRVSSACADSSAEARADANDSARLRRREKFSGPAGTTQSHRSIGPVVPESCRRCS